MKTILAILKRLIGFISFFALIIVMICPFAVCLILLGIDKANVIMSYAMRVPMNLLFGDGLGDVLLMVHKDCLNKN